MCRTTPVSSRAPSPKPSARRRTRQSPLPPWPMGKIGYSQGNTSADLLRQRWNWVGPDQTLAARKAENKWEEGLKGTGHFLGWPPWVCNCAVRVCDQIHTSHSLVFIG